MRSDIDVANIGLLELHIRKSNTFSGSFSFFHSLGSGIQRDYLSAPQRGFECVDALAAREIDNSKLIERYVGVGVLPFFTEKGTYKFVIQVSAPDAGRPEQLTLFVDWNEEIS